MVTVVTGDKNRLSIKGVKAGARYMVHHEAGGWWIEPEPAPGQHERPAADVSPWEVRAETLESFYDPSKEW